MLGEVTKRPIRVRSAHALTAELGLLRGMSLAGVKWGKA